MAKSTPEDQPVPAVHQATTSFVWDGVIVPHGSTVEAGHPMLEGRAGLFRPFSPTFTNEQVRLEAEYQERQRLLSEAAELEAAARAKEDEKAAEGGTE